MITCRMFRQNGNLAIKVLQHARGYAAKSPDVGIGSLGSKAKKKFGKAGPMLEKKVLPVETDATKLVNYVCGSCILKDGEDVAVKPDSDYPEWLWSVRTGKPPPLEELDPNTLDYWRRVKKMALRRNNRLSKLKKL